MGRTYRATASLDEPVVVDFGDGRSFRFRPSLTVAQVQDLRMAGDPHGRSFLFDPVLRIAAKLIPDDGAIDPDSGAPWTTVDDLAPHVTPVEFRQVVGALYNAYVLGISQDDLDKAAEAVDAAMVEARDDGEGDGDAVPPASSPARSDVP